MRSDIATRTVDRAQSSAASLASRGSINLAGPSPTSFGSIMPFLLTSSPRSISSVLPLPPGVTGQTGSEDFGQSAEEVPAQ